MTKRQSLFQQYRPRPNLEKGAHKGTPLQTNSKIIDKTKSPGADNSFHDFPQLEFTTLDDAARIEGCWKALSKQKKMRGQAEENEGADQDNRYFSRLPRSRTQISLGGDGGMTQQKSLRLV